MRLSIKETARVLKVSEEKIRGWIKEAKLPAHKVNEEYRVNKTDLIEWLSCHNKELKTDLFSSNQEAFTSLIKPLDLGGVHTHVKGCEKHSALHFIVDKLPLSENINKDHLYEMLNSRDFLGYGEACEGIALPHVRNPIVLPIAKPMIALFYFDELIDFGSLEGKMVHSRFLILSTTVREHLLLLTQLSCLLSHVSFRSLISCRSKKAEILAEMRRLEKEFKKGL